VVPHDFAMRSVMNRCWNKLLRVRNLDCLRAFNLHALSRDETAHFTMLSWGSDRSRCKRRTVSGSVAVRDRDFNRGDGFRQRTANNLLRDGEVTVSFSEILAGVVGSSG
jgi:hypothetical protein